MNPADAEKITRASKSNLALAFIALPRERRRDISVFYAFCRVIDDIADDGTRSAAERQQALDTWKLGLICETAHESPLAAAVRELIAKYSLPPTHFLEIIAGVEMDIAQTVYETWEELRVYCHRVASVVGLVSIEIFGYRDPGCIQYARELGLALQLTNILRDVGEDYANGGRIYLPRADMDRFGYNVAGLALGRHDEEFLALMSFEAERARGYYRAAEAALPAVDRRNMVAAEIMRTIYRRLLERMQRDGFRVFSKRYRLSKLEKSASIVSVLVRSRFG